MCNAYVLFPFFYLLPGSYFIFDSIHLGIRESGIQKIFKQKTCQMTLFLRLSFYKQDLEMIKDFVCAVVY
ncbi:hypothetical protein DERF_005425 [Dermatophagoides farinae]|uniref:Uncharacterized protein n=1 Tax=Dermatophagoides farinae TaxID=6954 RepID=A0A922L752_DERFA|nr:hypothetical protein DERF_005425 [Dermatophagoides farinae]